MSCRTLLLLNHCNLNNAHIMKPIHLKGLRHTATVGLIGLALGLTSCQTASTGGGGGGGGASVGRMKVIPQSPLEQKIIKEAMMVGAGVGAASGAVIARNNDINPYLGAAAGALAGAAVGNIVGKHQIRNLRIRQFNANETRQLADAARRYNDQLAAQVNQARKQVAVMDSQTRNKQQIIRDLERQLVNAEQVYIKREKLLQSATGSSASQYRYELNRLRSEKSALESLLAQAKRKANPTYVS